jgi:subtilisin family serine protease
MKFKKSLLGTMITLAVTTNVMAIEVANNQNLVSRDLLVPNALGTNGGPIATNKKIDSKPYIVQLRGNSGITYAESIGELSKSNSGPLAKNGYNASSRNMRIYTQRMKQRQARVASSFEGITILHNYVHTFNGFSARLTEEQVQALKGHFRVVAIHEDEVLKMNTATTPEWLGLVDSEGVRTSEFDGEGVIVGVVDSGISPDNLSFADDLDPENPYSELGSDTSPAWNGDCNVGDVEIRGEDHPAVFKGEDPEFSCNNKLIGAKFFGSVFDSVYGIQTDLGEFISPRDADGHGTHTASTAAGNADVPAFLSGKALAEITGGAGTISGIAPRARVAAYKVCWNADYVTPAGVDEAGCFGGDSMMAIDTAVADGVDVINYSISGSRTSLIAPQTLAMLRAEEAGVFVAVSAGNSGPTAVTVGTPAPWVTSVAASTYDGVTAVNGVEVTVGDAPSENLVFTEGGITAPLSVTGDVAGNLVLAEPLLGCFVDGVSTPLDNAEEIAGNIALISRGACNFSEKVSRAQDSGATAVIIYTVDGRPVTVLGGDGAFDIPGGMISEADGDALNSALTEDLNVSARLSSSIFGTQVEEGNLIAGFSSRGPNGSTGDVIKPDITAPGDRILAGTSNVVFQGVQGETQAYLSGTSMSAPHISGFAALLTQEHPTWSPTQIKSALMTSARQDLTKQESGEAADPFDFGSGHAVPMAASNPGLTYNAELDDYLGFLCGLGETTAVTAESGRSCTEITQTVSDDPSQLNYPSIAVGELSESETVFRTVTDVSGVDSSYTYSVEAPAGIAVTVNLDDGEDGTTLEVGANGTAGYSVTFVVTEDAILNEWAFGSITFTNTDDGTEVRSPIAVFPVPTIRIDVPESISTTLSRNRTSFPVEMGYSGTTSLDYAGLTAPFTFGSRTVGQDPDQSFTPFEPEQGIYGINMFAGTKVARFSLSELSTFAEGTDLDLFVYFRPNGAADEFVASSERGGSDEDVVIVNPRTAEEGFYIVFINGWFVPAPEPVEGEEPEVGTVDTFPWNWAANGPENGTRVVGSSRAIEGRFNNIRVMTGGLEENFGNLPYMGGVTFYDDEGNEQGTTILEIQP